MISETSRVLWLLYASDRSGMCHSAVQSRGAVLLGNVVCQDPAHFSTTDCESNSDDPGPDRANDLYILWLHAALQPDYEDGIHTLHGCGNSRYPRPGTERPHCILYGCSMLQEIRKRGMQGEQITRLGLYSPDCFSVRVAYDRFADGHGCEYTRTASCSTVSIYRLTCWAK